jgi:hypothetical protein
MKHIPKDNRSSASSSTCPLKIRYIKMCHHEAAIKNIVLAVAQYNVTKCGNIRQVWWIFRRDKIIRTKTVPELDFSWVERCDLQDSHWFSWQQSFQRWSKKYRCQRLHPYLDPVTSVPPPHWSDRYPLIYVFITRPRSEFSDRYPLEEIHDWIFCIPKMQSYLQFTSINVVRKRRMLQVRVQPGVLKKRIGYNEKGVNDSPMIPIHFCELSGKSLAHKPISGIGAWGAYSVRSLDPGCSRPYEAEGALTFV